jgi:3-aminobutyryl-CoA ammonia-lyase
MPEAFLRVRVGAADAHYGGDLVSGAQIMKWIGDAATELVIRNDGDEGLLRAWESVEFFAPVYAGDYLEVRGRLIAEGKTSRTFELEVIKVISPRRDISASAADVLAEPVIVCRAWGTGVVPADRQRQRQPSPATPSDETDRPSRKP